MKTLGYIDRCDKNRIEHIFYIKDDTLFRQKRVDRILQAMRELEGLGNVYITYNHRVISKRGY